MSCQSRQGPSPDRLHYSVTRIICYQNPDRPKESFRGSKIRPVNERLCPCTEAQTRYTECANCLLFLIECVSKPRLAYKTVSQRLYEMKPDRQQCGSSTTFLKLGSQSLATKSFTVVSVTLSPRTSGSAAIDNNGRTGYQTLVGTTNLGVFFGSGTDDHIWHTGVEIVGTVLPSNFTGHITLTRNADAYRFYRFSTLNANGNAPDQSLDNVRDDDDQEGKYMTWTHPVLGMRRESLSALFTESA